MADDSHFVIINRWYEARAELRAVEQVLHPDVVDRYGRVWTWKGGDLYSHDETLAFPLALIQDHERLGLPRPELVDNPNYARLCGICRQNWPVPNER